MSVCLIESNNNIDLVIQMNELFTIGEVSSILLYQQTNKWLQIWQIAVGKELSVDKQLRNCSSLIYCSTFDDKWDK